MTRIDPYARLNAAQREKLNAFLEEQARAQSALVERAFEIHLAHTDWTAQQCVDAAYVELDAPRVVRALAHVDARPKLIVVAPSYPVALEFARSRGLNVSHNTSAVTNVDQARGLDVSVPYVVCDAMPNAAAAAAELFLRSRGHKRVRFARPKAQQQSQQQA